MYIGGTLCCGGGHGSAGCLGAVVVLALVTAFFVLLIAWQLKEIGVM
ncbi:MAG: hypothetical protein R3C45_00905 [Phycisphaerales bacterium]